MKLKLPIIVTFITLCLFMRAHEAMAQQAQQYTQYMYNTAVLNPAYAGSNANLEATLLHRSQWVGIDGAPESQSLSVIGKLREKIGLGLTLMNDNSGAANNINVNGLFAYHLSTGYKTKLSLGLNAGFDVLKVDWSKGTYADNQDPVFADNLNKIRPTIGVGAFFYSNRWYLGFSTNNLLSSQLYNDDDETVTDRKSQYYFMMGYVAKISNTLKFKPALLTKHVAGAPITVDVSANFLLNEKFALGVAYRYDDAISALAGFHLAKRFFIGYAFDYSLTGLQNYNDGSHEIILKYSLFDAKKRALSPRFF